MACNIILPDPDPAIQPGKAVIGKNYRPPAKTGASGLLSDYPGLVALAGVLQPGDKVQVMARYNDARGGRYEVVASTAPVLVVNDKGVLLGLTLGVCGRAFPAPGGYCLKGEA